MPSCAPSSSVPWFCPFGQHTLMCTNHTRFSKPHQLFVVRVCGPSASPMSVEVCGGARRMCESRVGPISFGWSQIDDGRTVGLLWLWVGLARAVVSALVVASSSLQVFWGNHCSGVPLQHVLFFRVWEVRTDLHSMVKQGVSHCHLMCQGVMGLEVPVLVRVCSS